MVEQLLVRPQCEAGKVLYVVFHHGIGHGTGMGWRVFGFSSQLNLSSSLVILDSLQ